MKIKDHVRPEILDLPTINAPEVSHGMIRMNANESPSSPWQKSKAIPLNRYPPVRPNSLTQEMAKFYGINAEEILLSRGSTEAIDIIMRTFCVPNKDSILISPPTFDMYQFFANLNSIFIDKAPLKAENNFILKIEDLIDAISSKTKLIFISTPNSPCGSSVTTKDIISVLDIVSDNAIVVVDEAYIEFSPIESMVKEIQNYENLIVLRTLSKAFSLAGARCGALISSTEGIELLKKTTPPFSFSTPTINHIESVLSLSDPRLNNSHINNIITQREYLKEMLLALACTDKIWKSDGNFLLVRFKNINSILSVLEENQILVGQIKNNADLKDCLRITIGNPEENKKLLKAISSSL